MILQEANLVDHIVSKLKDGGYLQRKPANLDLKVAIDQEIFLQFLKKTQPDSLKKLENNNPSAFEYIVVESLKEQLDNHGIIDVLRNGIKISEILIDCAFFKPVSTLNQLAQHQYGQNILTVIREAGVDSEISGKIDLLLCLNGLPIATAEVKDLETEQSFRDAEKQYRELRDPESRLLEFKKRTLVHFAIDQHEISMTTRLDWEKTKFRPFNQGRNGGAGNPDNKPYRTSYLWEKIWQKEIWLDILKDFIHLQTDHHIDVHIPTKGHVVFPRYHQLDCVLQLTEASKKGPGTNYLIQHSTGSGKSNSIAWLAFKLFSLHSEENKTIFDSVIVLSDRVGIVGQLQETISQFAQTTGVVESVKRTTTLADILRIERKILVTTQQKFHNLINKLDTLKGNNFAVIIDEAHSSQGGKSQAKVKGVLSLNEDAKKIESEVEAEDFVDKLEKIIAKRGPKKNISFYAFTATPRDKTLSLFGALGNDSKQHPFHVYSMDQAIEEGYILDVLRNIVTYKRFFEIQKSIPEDKAVEAKKTLKTLMQFVDEHETNIDAKSKVIINHFMKHSLHKMLGNAKAMIVAARRSQALKYKLKIDEYLREIGHEEIKTLVAFSGDLFDETTKKRLNENKINGTRTDEELREEFEKPECKFLIVADKYQTGFNQPLLHSMYVDKKLSGIRAVQTLSRLNRTYDEKHDVFVLLFKNDEKEIKTAFEPYYITTELTDKTSPEYLKSLYNKIISYNIITRKNIEDFAKLWADDIIKSKDEEEEEKNQIVSPIILEYEKIEEVKQDEFRLNIRRFTSEYSFLSQITTYDDPFLEGLYLLCVHVVKFLRGTNSFDYQPEPGELALKHYKLIRTGKYSISLDSKTGTLVRSVTEAKPREPEELAYLSEIIKMINDRHGRRCVFGSEDIITTEEWRAIIENMQELREYAQANELKYFQSYFVKEFDKVVARSYDTNPRLVSWYFDDEKLKNEIDKKAAELYHKWAQENQLPPITKTTPALNRMNFRQTIGKCKKYIQWIDRYFGIDALEFLVDGIDKENVKEVRLLTSIYQSGLTKELYQRFKTFSEEMKKQNIYSLLYIITNKELHFEIHDRIIEGANVVYNVPSAKQVNLGQYSEIKKTSNRPPFMRWWTNPENLDIIADWDKIQQKISEQKMKKMYPINCTECGIADEVNFAPDGTRPVYCYKHKYLRYSS